MNSCTVFKELISHFMMIIRLSIFELKIKYEGSYLGLLWVLLNPLIQIGVYWFAFGIGLRSGNPIGDIPYIYWLTVGLIAWFYINSAISKGTSSISSRINVISKMNFPLSTVPVFVVISHLIEHLFLVVVMLIIFQFTPYGLSFNNLNVIYFIFSATCFLIALSMLTSCIATVIKDFKILMSSIIKFAFFLSPILWTPEHLSIMVQWILKLNPIYYLIEGYRSCFFSEDFYIVENIGYTIYFWIVVVILYVLGANLVKKIDRNLLDFM